MTSALGILIIAAFLVYSVMSIARPMWAFALLIMMWPLEQLVQSYVPFFALNGIVFNIYVAVIVGFAALRRLSFGGISSLKEYANPTLYAVTSLYLIGLASLAWTPGFEYALGQVKWLGPYIFVGVYLATMLPQRIEEFGEFRRVMMIVGGLIAILILINPNLKFYGDRAMVNLVGSVDRANPLALAEIGAIIAVIAAISRDRGVTGIKVALRITVVIIGIGLALKSGTRGQVIAAFIVILFLYPTARKSGHLTQTLINLAGLCLFGIVLMITVSTFVTSENLDRWSLRSLLDGGAGRLEFVFMYLNVFIDSPQAWLFGFGSMAYAQVVDTGGVSFVENLFAECLFEFGVLGLALISIIIIQSVRMSFWMIKNSPTGPARINATVLFGLWLMYFIIASKSYNIWTAFPFFCICVTINKCGLIAKKEWLFLEEHAFEEEEEEEEDYDEFAAPTARPIH